MSHFENGDRGIEPGQTIIYCVYFKDSGKYKYDGEARFDLSLFDGCIYPSEYGKRLRALKLLPGLESGHWSGPFTVEVYDKYTELVPKE